MSPSSAWTNDRIYRTVARVINSALFTPLLVLGKTTNIRVRDL